LGGIFSYQSRRIFDDPGKRWTRALNRYSRVEPRYTMCVM